MFARKKEKGIKKNNNYYYYYTFTNVGVING